MKVLLTFCLIISTSLFNSSKLNSNLKSEDENLERCLTSYRYLGAYHLYFAGFYLFQQEGEVDYFNQYFKDIVAYKEDSDYYCSLVTHPCIKDIEDYLSTLKKVTDSFLEVDYSSIQNYLDSLYEVTQHMSHSCDNIPAFTKNQKTSLEKRFLFSKMRTPVFKHDNVKSTSCESNLNKLYEYITDEKLIFIYDFLFEEPSVLLGDYIKLAQIEISQIKDNCSFDFVIVCKDPFVNFKNDNDVFYSSLLSKDYILARAYIQTIIDSYLRAQSCGKPE